MWIPALQEDAQPLYKALAEAMERDVFAGRLRPGDRLPTHRDLADALGVSVSTVTKGYAEAARRGLAAGTVGRGMFVASDATAAPSLVAPEPHAPGMVELGLIEPLTGLDPDVGLALRRLARSRDLNLYLRYTDPRGLPEHREAGVAWAGRYHMPARPEDVVVCAGSQHALTCAFAAQFRPGDRIATDCLTYPGVKKLAALFGLRLVPVPMDAAGMTPEGLDAACRREAVKGVYLIPGLHNPTTLSMPLARRQAIAAMAERHDLAVVEDAAYDLTAFDPPAPLSGAAAPAEVIPPVAALIPDRCVYVAGVSKAMAAGLRVAFAIAPGRCRARMAEAVLHTMWMTPPLNAALVAQWIADGTADRTLRAKHAEAAHRNMVARAALGGLSFASLPAGYFIWLHLPAPWTGASFEASARGHGINLFGAERFVVGDTPAPAAARVSLTGTPDRAALGRALGVLVDILAGRTPPPLVL